MSTHEARTNATMNEELPDVVTIDDADSEPVKADTATDLKEKETKVKKGGTGGWWSEEKKVAFMSTVESQKESRGDTPTSNVEFWRHHAIPALAMNQLTADCAQNTPASLQTKYSVLSSLLTKTNKLLQAKIKENVGKEGAVYKNNAGEYYSGYGEEEGRDFVAKVYHEIVNTDRKKRKPFVSVEYAKGQCVHPLFNFFYEEFILWEKPTGKTLGILDLQMLTNKKKHAAAEEAEKASAEEASIGVEPKTVEKKAAAKPPSHPSKKRKMERND